MAEENQAQQEPKEPQRVTTKDPKKVEAGKRLAAINRKRREVKEKEEAQNGGMSQYYEIWAGAVIAVGVIGGLGYYIYRTKKGQVSREVPNSPAGACTLLRGPRNLPPQQPRPQTNHDCRFPQKNLCVDTGVRSASRHSTQGD